MFEEQLLEKVNICQEILRDTKNELYLNMRFLDVALNTFSLQSTMERERTATDGVGYYFNPEYLIEQYKESSQKTNRCYLHSVLHCLFGHLWHPVEKEKEDLWNLACDITVEYIMDNLYYRCLRNHSNPYRKLVYNNLLEQMPVINAEAVFHVLEKNSMDPRAQARLMLEFLVDEHDLWQRQENAPNAPMEQQNQWKDIRDKMETELETFSKEAAEDSKSLVEQLKVENRERYDYRTFLKKFCVLKEEMQVDMDSFDYIFYNYGMEMYGNMPLIEPQETKEVKKIEDFVIVIDTSMSCKTELVQKFLEETYSILSQAESFYRRFRIHIIQCDERVQSDVVIEKAQQLRDYMEQFEVKGMGGTDFRPAFEYVNRLLTEKAFQKLRGLIYFTDGYGTFPLKKPLYDVAFVFFKEDYLDVDVPAWAIKLILGEEDIGNTVEASRT
ncbi:vWA domain-containing protein [Roseburia sp. 499]|uniref:vWA domain-containing protein n=1 Tax=Roseburia sp. 499 TaxID=1261634 RepID=UPI000952822A|nr:VWA-like domain-containing protein [Roseburia sp. 499]WVK71604.1 VWA-like domain-containing protein [Roseburia sp. 499]